MHVALRAAFAVFDKDNARAVLRPVGVAVTAAVSGQALQPRAVGLDAVQVGLAFVDVAEDDPATVGRPVGLGVAARRQAGERHRRAHRAAVGRQADALVIQGIAVVIHQPLAVRRPIVDVGQRVRHQPDGAGRGGGHRHGCARPRGGDDARGVRRGADHQNTRPVARPLRIGQVRRARGARDLRLVGDKGGRAAWPLLQRGRRARRDGGAGGAAGVGADEENRRVGGGAGGKGAHEPGGGAKEFVVLKAVFAAGFRHQVFRRANDVDIRRRPLVGQLFQGGHAAHRHRRRAGGRGRGAAGDLGGRGRRRITIRLRAPVPHGEDDQPDQNHSNPQHLLALPTAHRLA